MSAAFAQNVDQSTSKPEAVALRLDTRVPQVDGHLDEACWDAPARYGNFIQRNPEDGQPSSQQTEFAILYNSDYLYVGIWAYDTNPDEILGILTRRDESSPSDWVYVSIDSYHDHRTAFEFGLNAVGVKQDLRRFDDTNADFEWDAVWEGAVQITAEGYTAEFAIPFRELRFNSGDDMTWGLNVYRELPRNNNELAVWGYWSREETGFVSNYGTLTGLVDLQAKQPIYLAPYVMGNARNDDEHLGELSSFDKQVTLGMDLRKSFDLGLTINGTINPDFGQVEADPAEFNLTEFESYFNEKRPFFMEGRNILNFSLGFGDGDNSSNTLFYSRRIGRAPQGYPMAGDGTVTAIEMPEFTRILGAGKLTGKLDNGLSLGLMAAMTAEEKASITYESDSTSSNVVEPATSYLLSRIQQDFRKGQTTLGGILTHTQRYLDETGMDWLREKAVTGGIDFNHNFAERTWQIQSALAFSRVSGSQESIYRAQTHPSRYFQRPDAPHLSVDTSATSLSGFAGKFILGRSKGKWSIFSGVLATSPGFEVNDLGYMRSVDNINEFFWAGYRNWEPGDFLLRYNYNINQWANWTFGGEQKSLGGNVNGSLTFKNNWGLGGGINLNRGGVVPYHLRGGPAIQGPDNLSIWAYGYTDGRKPMNLSVSTSYFSNADNVLSLNLSPQIQWRPRQNISLSAGPNFNYMDDTWAWVAAMEDSNSTRHYIFSGFEMLQSFITMRANVTLSTTLSLQYYAQAFLMGGDYHDYIEVADPTAKDFEKRFDPLHEEMLTLDNNGALQGVDTDLDNEDDYWPVSFVYSDFIYRELKSNLVLRWEYSTGSVIYLVWSKGASAADPTWDKDLVADFKSLSGLNSDNIFLIKINRLLNI